MIVVDSSVWIDHFRKRNRELEAALRAGFVAMHPMVIGELALGSIPKRAQTLADISHLVTVPVASDRELLEFVERRSLAGRGIGYVDAHLLASCLVSGATMWTNDRRLDEVAVELGVA